MDTSVLTFLWKVEGHDMIKVYLGGFTAWATEDRYGGGVTNEFELTPSPEPTYVFAAYDNGGYEGDAVVIISEDGETFSVVEGSHCSCYGLEGQWSTTEHGVEEVLRMFCDREYGAANEYKTELVQWLFQFN
ncbi:MAG TPA: hypothetical protein V6D20_25285 [Candidatus Obscuribacterales bacterium]